MFFDLFVTRAAPFSALPEPELSEKDERALAAGTLRPPAPVVFRRNSDARTPGDFVHGGAPWLRLVSARFAQALRSAGCTGWDTYPVVLLDEDGTECGDHVGLAVTGRCGPIEPDRSATIPDRPMWRRGLFFDAATWDGSDLFTPARGGGLLVTDAARGALQAAGIAGIGFEPLEDVEYFQGTFE
jgi:hypothetical protein